MANSHSNTSHTRLPIRTAERVRIYAERRGVTRATAYDLIVEEYMGNHAPEILDETAHLPEPRRAVPKRSKPADDDADGSS